ncbi:MULTISPECIES: hypothetical protein [unclassified Shewanella]|uniref:hypothetical protein n=1 Tax=unclassified Shewanella TaxID=196818 RepID=UPI0017824AFA|nr:hypothetical protein [Shewanella sp. WPAGA9]
MTLLFALMTAYFATLLLNAAGTFTNNNIRKGFSALLNITSVVMFITVYGTARGVFVYLAVIALFGIILSFFNRNTTISANDIS